MSIVVAPSSRILLFSLPLSPEERKQICGINEGFHQFERSFLSWGRHRHNFGPGRVSSCVRARHLHEGEAAEALQEHDDEHKAEQGAGEVEGLHQIG